MRPTPVDIVIGFEGGIPVSIDGESLGGVALVERLHELGGAHGVGRIDHVEDRLVGIKSREIYEAPAAVILNAAHHALEGLVLSKEQLRFNRLVADELAQIIYDGLWFSALSRDLRTYTLSSQRVVSGEVRMRLDHGSASRRRASLPAVAVRQEPRHVRRGRRLRPRVRGGLHRDLRAPAPRGGGPPRRGRQAPRRRLDVDRAAARQPADDPRRGREGRRGDAGAARAGACVVCLGKSAVLTHARAARCRFVVGACVCGIASAALRPAPPRQRRSSLVLSARCP